MGDSPLDRVEAEGKLKGRTDGLIEGKLESVLCAVGALVLEMHWTPEEAIAKLQIRKGKYSTFWEMFQAVTELVRRYERMQAHQDPLKNMCEVFEQIENKARVASWYEARDEGRLVGNSEAIQALMDSMQWTAEQTMDALKIPEEDKDAYRRILESLAAPV